MFILTSTPTAQPPQSDERPARTLVVDSNRALTAVQTLAANPGSAVAVQRYQDDFAASGISSVSRAIHETLASYSANPTIPSVVALRLRKAQYILRSTLFTTEAALTKAQKEVDDALETSSEIRCQLEETRVRVPREVLGMDEGSEVQEAVKIARRDVKVTMDGLKWWSMVTRVDDIRHVVGAAVERAWCRDLERNVCILCFCQYVLTDCETISGIIAYISHWQPSRPSAQARAYSYESTGAVLCTLCSSFSNS